MRRSRETENQIFGLVGSDPKRGFTLLELMIVIMIIGVLSSLILPRLTGQTEKARMAEAINMLSAMRKAELGYFDEHGEYLALPSHYMTWNPDVLPAWNKIGLEPPSCLTDDGTKDGSLQCIFIYSAYKDAFDAGAPCGQLPAGTVSAERTSFRLGGTGTGGWIFLHPDGTWCGSDNYANDGPYPVLH